MSTLAMSADQGHGSNAIDQKCKIHESKLSAAKTAIRDLRETFAYAISTTAMSQIKLTF